MNIIEVKKLLREVGKKEGKFNFQRLFWKKFSRDSINFCISNSLIIENEDKTYSLSDDGATFLNQSDIADNTKKFSELMEDFSKKSDDTNKQLLSYTSYLIALAIITALLSIITILYSINQAHIEKIAEINILVADINGLDRELDLDVQAINEIEDKLPKGIISSDIIMDNLKKSVSNSNIRNETIKLDLIRLEYDLLDLMNSVKTLNSPEFALIYQGNPEGYYNKSERFAKDIIKQAIIDKDLRVEIGELRTELKNLKTCVILKRDFDKC